MVPVPAPRPVVAVVDGAAVAVVALSPDVVVVAVVAG